MSDKRVRKNISRLAKIGIPTEAQVDGWKTYNRLDEKAQAYERAADDEYLRRVRRLLLPGESVDDMIDRVLG